MKTQNILIVEDDVLSREMKGKILQDRGCETPMFHLHQGIFHVLIILLLALFVIQTSQAQEAFPKMSKPDSGVDRHGARGQSASYVLTEDQKKTIETLHRNYMAESMPIRREISVLKIELRRLLSDPHVQPQILYDQQRKISTFQARLEELSLSYQIRVKSLLTKEQLEQLPQDWIIEMIPGHDMMMEVGSPRQKGHR
jgi:Spy/CpxP family protein refolding chaperone